MTDQELHKLSRKDLLELLVSQGHEMEKLKEELEKIRADLQKELETAQNRLQERQLQVEQAGSIAEAALQVNGVFEAAQAAAKQYLENIRQRSEQAEERCARMESEAREQAELQLQAATRMARKLEEETKRRCEEMEKEAREKSESYWNEVSVRLQSFYQEHQGLKELLSMGGKP